MEEIWKDKKDYEGHYQVSNCGRVKSIKFGKEIILKQHIRGGYYSVVLSKNGILKIFKVHRLVAQAFIPNPNNLTEVNHKDENKLNNNVDNMEWCDRTYNNTYGTRIEKCSKKLSKPVLQYTLEGEFVKEWESTAECGRNGFKQGAVAACCRGERKTHHKFIWKYK